MVRYGPAGQTWFEQQTIFFEKSINFNRLKWFDEEALKALMSTAVKDGSPGDDQTRFVFQDSSDKKLHAQLVKGVSLRIQAKAGLSK